MIETLKNIIYMARRFKLATAFNTVGLVMSFITFYLLMTQVIYQVTYNHGLDDYERLYRMETDFAFDEWEFSYSACRPFADALNNLPQVESYSLVTDVLAGNHIDLYTHLFIKGKDTTEHVLAYGNNTVVSALTSRVLDGSIEWTDSDREGLIIPASFALEFFGSTQVAGKELVYRETILSPEYRALIRGVYEDFPENSEPGNYIYKSLKDWELYTLNFAYRCVIKFKEVPQDMNAFADSIRANCIRNLRAGLDTVNTPDLPDMITAINETRIRFIPLENSYLEHNSFNSGESGYRGMLMTLVLACLLVIIISAINFLNFTLVESPMRVRGLNTRIVLGAKRSALRRGLVIEGVVTSLVACLIAIVVCHLISKLLPAPNLFAVGSIALEDHWGLVAIMPLIAIITGVVASLYPAMFATSISPTIALKGSFGLTPPGRRLRMVLVCLQFFIAMLLAIYIGFLYMQSRYIINTSYGFTKDRLLTSTLPIITDDEILEHVDSVQDRFKNRLKEIPGIESVSFSEMQLGSTDGHNTLRTWVGDHFIRFSQMFTDADYMRTMGIEIVEGRDFEPNDSAAIIINESTRKKWDWLQLGTKTSIGFDDESTDSATVVGVCKDIRYATMRIINDKPFFIIRVKNVPCYTLNVRVAADAPLHKVRQQASELIQRQFGSEASELVFFNDTLEKTYQDEFRFFQIFYLLFIICSGTMLIGVFCLTMFDAEYRRKEIGIRKVSGASTTEIMLMFSRHYGWLLLIGFAAAVPVAWLCGKVTLDYFAEHVSIPALWWLFPLSLLLVGGITLCVVILLCWRVARENPADSIMNE